MSSKTESGDTEYFFHHKTVMLSSWAEALTKNSLFLPEPAVVCVSEVCSFRDAGASRLHTGLHGEGHFDAPGNCAEGCDHP